MQADTVLAAYRDSPTHHTPAPHAATGPKRLPAHPNAAPNDATAPHHPAHAPAKPHAIPEQEIAEINEALLDPRVRAFLHLLRFEENNREGDAVYRIRYSDLSMKDPISDEEMRHYVGKTMSYTKDGRPITPGGAYQITRDTYNDAKRGGVVSDFLPASQDKIAAWRLTQKHVLQYIRDNNLDKAFRIINPIWSSLPGGANPRETQKEPEDRYQRYLAQEEASASGVKR